MVEKLKSRKLWVALGGIVTPLLAGASGAMSWPEAIGASAAVAISYVLGQSHVDAAEKRGPRA